MKKNSTAFFSFLLIGIYASAQHSSLRGIINDSSANQKLVNTTITLLKAKDSTLYKFTRSKEGGLFEMHDLDSGKYILMITHNRYADYFDALILEQNEKKDLGNIMMPLLQICWLT